MGACHENFEQLGLLSLSLSLLVAGISLGQVPGGDPPGGQDNPQNHLWTFDFETVYFNVDYTLNPGNPGPPLVPPFREVSGTEVVFGEGLVKIHSNPSERRYDNYRLMVFDANEELKWQSGGLPIGQVQDDPNTRKLAPFNGNMNEFGVISPPVTVRLDLQDQGGTWHQGTFRLTVGSSEEGTSWALKNHQRQFRFDIVTYWTCGIPSANSIPKMEVQMHNVKFDAPLNNLWNGSVMLWNSKFNADSSFGWFTEKNRQAKYRKFFDIPYPHHRARFASAIFDTTANPQQSLLRNVKEAFVYP